MPPPEPSPDSQSDEPRHDGPRYGANGDGSPAPAVTRAAAILDALASAGGDPLGLTDLARTLRIAKSSTSHLCQALEDARLIQRRENGYVLGRRTVELAGAYLADFDEVRTFYEECARTTELRNHVVQIALLDGTDVLYLARFEGRSRFRFAATIGDRFPAALTATGQAILADLPPEEVARRFAGVEIPRLTGNSLTTLHDLQDRLTWVRSHGYSFDDEGVHPGVVGQAVRLQSKRPGGAMLSLGVTVLKSLATADVLAELLRELRTVAAALSNPLVLG